MADPSVAPRPEVTAFVLLMDGRTGSTYLTEALNKHPNVRAFKERFSTLKRDNYGAMGQLGWARIFLNSHDSHLEEGYTSLGIKTNLRDVVDPDGFASLLQGFQARIVLLQRKNIIEWAVSYFNAVRFNEQTGDWNLYTEQNRLPPLSIDVELFDSWRESIESRMVDLEEYVATLGLPTLSVFYEDLLMDEESTLATVFGFLNVPYVPVQGSTIKNTSDDLREALANFDGLKAHYTGTPLRSYVQRLPAAPRGSGPAMT